MNSFIWWSAGTLMVIVAGYEMINARSHDLNHAAAQHSAVDVPGDVGTPTVEPLIAALKDTRAKVREDAANVLGKISDPRAISALISTLSDSNSLARKSAVDALVNIGAPAVDPLITSLSSSWPYRSGALDALGLIGTSAIEALIVRRYPYTYDVANALDSARDPDAVRPLIAILRDTDPKKRTFAISVLEIISVSRPIDPFIDALKDSDPRVRYGVVRFLGRTVDPHAVEAISAFLKNTDLKEIAENYQSLFGVLGSEGALIGALNKFGDLDMAKKFYQTDNIKLNAAADAYAKSHGFIFYRYR